MKKIEMKKVKEIYGYRAEEFCVKPKYYDYDYVSYYEAPELFAQAKELAQSVDGICIAIVTDDLGQYVLGDECVKGCSSKFVLFNAEECKRPEADARAITFNTGRGALTRYWYDRWIKFQPGSVV